MSHALVKIAGRMARAAGLAGLVALTASGAAQAANRIGWVFGDQPASAIPYTPNTLYSYNSVGGTVTIFPVSIGTYRVEFSKLYNGGPDDVQVTAYTSFGYCNTGGWLNSSKNTIAAYVNCFDATGKPANGYFTLLYQSRNASLGTPSRGIAFLEADQPTNPSYSPASAHQYNSTGGGNSLIRNSVGNYTATLPGLHAAGGDVQVTAVTQSVTGGPGTTPSRCKVQSWKNNVDATFINVLCFNSAGRPADEMFDLAFAQKVSFGLASSATTRGAYAWADQLHNTAGYTPNTVFQYNGFATGPLTAQKIGTGQYTVSIPSLPPSSTSNVIVTAFGNGNHYCNVLNWGAGIIYVNCYAQGGGLVDAQFDVGFQDAN
jgi:hypothetical protein